MTQGKVNDKQVQQQVENIYAASQNLRTVVKLVT